LEFTKKSIKYTVLAAQSVFVDRIFESIFIQLNLSNTKKCIVGSVYRPGTAHPTLTASDAFVNFSELLSNVLDELSSFNIPIYLLGDLNLDVLQVNASSNVSDYINLLFSYGLLQVITRPTRCTDHSATLIDHIITNSQLSSYETCIITSSVSDHFPVVFFLQTAKPHA
jgi:exonuclease III